jgi:hypothetical protein
VYRYVFAIGDDAYCCWEHDLPARNERFLASIDAEYFNYVAQRHLEQLEGDDRQRAAVALRAAYHHGLETLFSLLGALAQAPDAVPAWIPKCSTTNLRKVVAALRSGTSLLTQTGPQSLTLRQLSVVVHQYCWPNDVPSRATGERFGQLWKRFAQDFLDDHHIAEYNSIKHGLRVSAGGFVLRMGMEEVYGVLAPEANMQTVGASPYGTSFYEPEPVGPDHSARHHFRIRHYALNWRAEAMALRLQLLAWSINNVVAGLRCLNGAPPGTVRFERPQDPAAFEHAWEWPVGVHASNFDLVVDPTEVDPVPRPALLSELRSRTQDGAA